MKMIKALTSKQSAAAFAGLILVMTVCLRNHVQAVSVQTDPLRGALRNPKDRLWGRRSPNVFKVRMETSKGSIVIETHREWAPKGCDRFYGLVRAGFFDNSRFFRVRPGFIAQFGIAGDPVVTVVWKEQTIPDDPVRQSNTRGTITYAMTGPDTRTTQLYINLSDNSRLDKDGFAPLGKVVEGMDVADQLYSGYGEDAGGGMRGGKQGKIFEGGSAYLDREFPRLDKLIRATIVKR